MNHDQIEALVHQILAGVAALLAGFGLFHADSSTATTVVSIGGSIITGVLAIFLSAKANTPAAVQASADAHVIAAQAVVDNAVPTPPKA